LKIKEIIFLEGQISPINCQTQDKAGKIIDARLVKAARRPGKDNDASFTKKGGKTVYGYKDHVAVDPKSEFVTEFVCTPADVHDSQVLEELVEGEEKALFADKAYNSQIFSRIRSKVEKVFEIFACILIGQGPDMWGFLPMRYICF